MKTILVHVTPDPDCGHHVDVAMALAVQHRAHVVGVFTKSPYVTPPSIVGRGASAVFAREMEASAKEAEQDARAAFARAAEKASVGSEWIHHDGEVMDGLADSARYSDLLVVGQTPPETIEDMVSA